MINDGDLLDRLDFIVDPDAEPADLDEVLAEFLLAFIRQEEGDCNDR